MNWVSLRVKGSHYRKSGAPEIPSEILQLRRERNSLVAVAACKLKYKDYEMQSVLLKRNLRTSADWEECWKSNDKI